MSKFVLTDDALNRYMRSEHRCEIAETATGAYWVCECGKAGKGRSTYNRASAARDRHLQAERRRAIRAALRGA